MWFLVDIKTVRLVFSRNIVHTVLCKMFVLGLLNLTVLNSFNDAKNVPYKTYKSSIAEVQQSNDVILY